MGDKTIFGNVSLLNVENEQLFCGHLNDFLY